MTALDPGPSCKSSSWPSAGPTRTLDGTSQFRCATASSGRTTTTPREPTSATYVYEMDGQAWILVQLISAGSAHDLFGYAVALSGDVPAVGAYMAQGAVAYQAGAVYTFQLLNCLSMAMFDASGDGWNAATY